MKKITVIGTFVLLGMLTSCNDNVQTRTTDVVQPNPRISYRIDGGTYSVQTVDGCEYIVSSSKTDITHKGDCPNPIHRIHDTIYIKSN